MFDRNEIEILQVALAHEERARAWYDREAEARKRTPAGALFDFLAAEEAGHIRKLSARFEIPETEATWDHRFLPSLIDLEKIAREAEETESDPLRRALSVAQAAEERAVEFYGTAAETVSDRNTRELLLALREEERIHLARIEEFREKI
ncbi:MAG: hypothetical protein Kow00128_13940 [Deltaproteobacteria bacterium]